MVNHLTRPGTIVASGQDQRYACTAGILGIERNMTDKKVEFDKSPAGFMLGRRISGIVMKRLKLGGGLKTG